MAPQSKLIRERVSADSRVWDQGDERGTHAERYSNELIQGGGHSGHVTFSPLGPVPPIRKAELHKDRSESGAYHDPGARKHEALPG